MCTYGTNYCLHHGTHVCRGLETFYPICDRDHVVLPVLICCILLCLVLQNCFFCFDDLNNCSYGFFPLQGYSSYFLMPGIHFVFPYHVCDNLQQLYPDQRQSPICGRLHLVHALCKRQHLLVSGFFLSSSMLEALLLPWFF